jgi:hypothetical protein
MEWQKKAGKRPFTPPTLFGVVVVHPSLLCERQRCNSTEMVQDLNATLRLVRTAVFSMSTYCFEERFAENRPQALPVFSRSSSLPFPLPSRTTRTHSSMGVTLRSPRWVLRLLSSLCSHYLPCALKISHFLLCHI